MKSNLKIWTRVLLIVCAAALLSVVVFPIWQIQLAAPQYPEGLVLLIYASKLGGNVDIINGLNHYIGMKTLHVFIFQLLHCDKTFQLDEFYRRIIISVTFWRPAQKHAS